MSDSLRSDLERFAARHGLSRQLHASAVVQAANQVAQGRYVAQSFRAGTLRLVVRTQAERYRLHGQRSIIGTEVNQVLKQPLVLEVQILVRSDTHPA